MDEQMQQQIVQLVQAAMQGDQQAQQQLQQIMEAAQQGDPQAQQIAQLIQQIVQQMQGQQAQMAKFGAKLNYIKYLRGQCPEGYEMQYFKNGGKAGCRKCKKAEEGMKGPKPKNAVEEFKCGRKMKKKACGGNVDKAKCGKKIKKGQDGVIMRATPENYYDRYRDNNNGTTTRNTKKGDWVRTINYGPKNDTIYNNALGMQFRRGTPGYSQVRDSFERTHMSGAPRGIIYKPKLRKK